MRRLRAARSRRGLIFAVLFAAVPAPHSVSAQDEVTGAVEEIEPVDVNEAGLSELLEIPGMDPDLARAILSFREESGGVDSLEALYRSPLITPARLLPVVPWLKAERSGGRTFLKATASARSTSLPVARQDFKVALGRGSLHLAARMKRGLPPDEENPAGQLLAGVLRARLPGSLTLTAGDVAPVESFGLLVGLSSRPPMRGPHSLPGPGRWHAREAADLPRSVPAPEGRVLRGAALAFGPRAVIGVFRYGAGAAGVTGDEEAMPARVFLAGLDLGGGAASSARLSPRGFLYDGRLWSGLSGALSLSGGRVGFEIARDPSGRHRMALAAAGRQGRRVQFRLSYTGGAPGFVNPLGSDSEHQPVTSHLIDTGSNENRSETAVLVRASPVRRLALELEVRGAVDRSTVRRSWDRPVGTGILRIEASPGGGWSLAGETRIENRGAPGPSAEADAPVRRHSARLTAGWEKGRAHLRFDWQGRFDLELPPGGAGTATLSQVQDLVALRGRWPLSRLLWLAGGVAQYRLPPAAPAVLYEERPANLPPGVFVRGAEDRVHGAFGFVTGMFEIGSFLSRRRDRSSGELNVSWGLMFGVARGRP